MAAQKKTTKPRGRPTSYKPEFCDLLVEHMAKGYSFESFAGVVGTTEETIHDWKRTESDRYKPEFSESYKIGKAKSRMFWETLGMRGLAGIPFTFVDEHGKKQSSSAFNAATYIFNMKNRFNWTDKQDFTTKGKELPVSGFVIYRPEKLPNNYEEKMKTPDANSERNKKPTTKPS